MRKQFKAMTLALMLSVGLAGCADTQTINQQAASSYTQTINQMKQQGVIDTSSTTSKRIQKVFQRIKPYAEKANDTGVPFQWQITVMKNNELNAWAMPGGKMMFYTGLVERLKLNDNEIAVVMGHEMAHALKEHGKQKVNFNMATGLLGSIGNVALSAATGYDFSTVVGLTQEYGLNKPFSRSNETEADEIGLLLMAEAGYDPEASISLWQKMSAASGGSGGALEGLVSTHPTDAAREANLRKLMPDALELYKKSNKAG
ncbi:M48 family metallopeptidase [Pasteurellaceae bacterium USgator11]|nr:M48 family metallopeptidase [Pasteurellaceae bacterium UScroc12]TNG97758.1 M48 family metallopeptidase [Pasteurellaceae bacterium USgator41]TNG99145.1 M48 family metallopeptidase [Pasteurellaceae bacterium UScroc31]TNH03052.1 M48 family metallopeptidase [Pasteurellaceae bacterium USgator11]